MFVFKYIGINVLNDYVIFIRKFVSFVECLRLFLINIYLLN